MNEQEGFRLRRRVAAWSDGPGLMQAARLAEQYRDLLPRRITNAQLAGLEGVVRAAQTLGQVIAFTQHQGARAAAARRLDVQEYWDSLRQALQGLNQAASELGGEFDLPSDALTLWLAREFVQHLAVHSRYIGAVTRSLDPRD